MCGAGDPGMKAGIAIYMYACNTSMEREAFYSSDGDWLIVPQTGMLHIRTEMGLMDVAPKEICVIPRGIKFAVFVDGPENRGYICEIFNGNYKLPDLGPIGSNGLANPRDFKVPVAWYEDVEGEFKVVNKYLGELFEYENRRSCFDVVAWHGNYYPFKYDLGDFNVMNSVSYDHPDPSIFTVLTCQTATPGIAAVDLAIFPPRWMVAEHTFRPPFYHRNCMSEFMGNICGVYDAKTVGFVPGTASLHSCMAGHGPTGDVFEKASNAELGPAKIPDTDLAFMFETTYMMKIAPWATENLDNTYLECWNDMPKGFTP